jgi:hypothetical protein
MEQARACQLALVSMGFSTSDLVSDEEKGRFRGEE